MPSKLVRDKYSEIFEKEGISFHVADDQEYRKKLFEKLQEEAAECANENSPEKIAEEIADLQDVIEAICAHEHIRKDAIDWWRQRKEWEKGKFEKRIIRDEVKDL